MDVGTPLSGNPRESSPSHVTRPALYPLRFEPIFKRMIWGGRRLESVLNKPLESGSNYAESWEISDHGADESKVAEGPLAGSSLRELIRARGAELLGPALESRMQFPLLVKFLDAHQVLSVQVHPDDELGRRLVADNGKSEAWIILHVEPGSLIYAGLKPGVGPDHFRSAIEQGRVEPLLHRFEPKPGDCVFIPAGTVHAIGAGIVLAEVQQMSDATFRVFDWNRVDADGRPRPLHVAEALESTNFHAGPVSPVVPRRVSMPGGSREDLVSCPYFALERWTIREPVEIGSKERFSILIGLDGHADVRHGGLDFALARGETLLLPACLGPCEVIPRDEATILTCTVP